MADVYDAAKRRSTGRIGSLIKDKWKIDSRLGAGGMATVYAATHRNGNRVAIKMLHPEFSRDLTLRARFLREGYVANAVGHPGAVRVLDDDVTEDGSVFLVMELLEGESLEARRQRMGGCIPVEEAFTVGDQLLDLLAAAHSKGIVHRDIKPENIFVTQEGMVKVLDFGIARMRENAGMECTGTGLMLGTPDFMSPEQAGGHSGDVDARSDLWAAGATLFTLLSGQVVHQAETLRDHLVAAATTPARSLAEVARNMPMQVTAVVDRALALDKEQRWPDARTMQDALRWAYRAVLQGEELSMTIMAASSPVTQSSPRLAERFDDEQAPPSDAKTLLIPPTEPIGPAPVSRTVPMPVQPMPVPTGGGVFRSPDGSAHAVPALRPLPVPQQPAPLVTATQRTRRRESVSRRLAVGAVIGLIALAAAVGTFVAAGGLQGRAPDTVPESQVPNRVVAPVEVPHSPPPSTNPPTATNDVTRRDPKDP